MIEIQIYELAGLPRDKAERTRVVEECFVTHTFHVEVPEENRYFVARVTRTSPPPQQYSIPEGEEDARPDGVPMLRKLVNGQDDALIARVFQTMQAMTSGQVKSEVINPEVEP